MGSGAGGEISHHAQVLQHCGLPSLDTTVAQTGSGSLVASLRGLWTHVLVVAAVTPRGSEEPGRTQVDW